MVQHGRYEFAQSRHRRDQVRAVNGVFLNYRPLLRREPRFLGENRGILIVNLSYVVKECRSPDLLNGNRIVTHQARDLDCIVLNPTRMARRVRISCFDRLDHQLKQLTIRLLKLNVGGIELSEAQNWQPKRGGQHRSEASIDPSKNEDDRKCEEIDAERRCVVLLPDLKRSRVG